jgi:hypothetical protein
MMVAMVAGAQAQVDVTQFAPDPTLRTYSVYATDSVYLPSQSGTATGGSFGSGGGIRLENNIKLRSPLLTAGRNFSINNVYQNDTTGGAATNSRTRVNVAGTFTIGGSNSAFLNAVQVGSLNPAGNDIGFRDSVYVAGAIALGGDRIQYNGRVQVGGTFNAGGTGKTQFQTGSSLRLSGDATTFVGQTAPTGTLYNVAYPSPGPLGNPPVLAQSVLPGYNIVGYSPPATLVDINTLPIYSHTGTVKRTAAQMSDTAIKTFNCLAALGAAYCNGDTLKPGYYGNLTVNDNGVALILGEGFYSFSSITVGSGSKIVAVQPTGKRTFVYSQGNITASGSNSFYGPADALGASGYGTGVGQFLGGTFMMMSGADIVIPSDLTVWATISAAKGTVHLNNQVKIYGQVFGKYIIGDNNIDFGLGAYIPFDPIVPTITINRGTNITTVEGPGSGSCTMPTGTFPSLANPACRDTIVYVTIDKANAYAVGLSYKLVDVSAVNASGWTTGSIPPNYYGVPSGSLTIPAGSTQVGIPLKIIDNTIYQGSVSFKIILSNPVNAKFGPPDSTADTILFTILDNEVGALVVFDSASYTVAKNGGSKTVRIKLIDGSSGALTNLLVPDTIVFDTLVRGTPPALLNSHYTIPKYAPGAGDTAIIPAGQSYVDIPIGILNDTVYGPDRLFRLRIRKASIGTIGNAGRDSTTVLIQNNYAAPAISVNDTTVYEGDTARFTIRLSGKSGLPACFRWRTKGVTAVASFDYVGVSLTSVCILPGSTTMTVPVVTLADDLYEPPETFQLQLFPDSGITRTGSDTVGIGTILNRTPMPGIQVSDASVVRSATTSTVLTFTVRLIDTAGKTVLTGVAGTVGFKIVPITAVKDTDYRDTTGTFTFRANTDSVDTIRITVPPDSRWYANPLQFRLVLTSPVNIDTTAKNSKPSGLGSIYTAVGQPSLHVYDTSATEGNNGSSNPIVFRVALLDSTGAPVTSRTPFTFTWSTSDGTAVGGTDFTAKSNVAATLAAGQNSTTLSTTLIGNNIDQPDRTFTVRLTPTSPAGTGKSNEDLTATGTILDDDAPVRVAIDDQTGYRPQANDSVWVFHVTLRDPASSAILASGKPVTFRLRTIDSTALVAMNDYVAYGPTTITLPIGKTDSTIRITVRKDLHFAPTLAFKLVADSLVNATAYDTVGLGTILNSNPKPLLKVIGPGLQNEGDTAKVLVRLVDPRTNDTTWSRLATPFTWVANDSVGGARHDSDYVPLSTSPVSIPSGASSTILRYRLVVHAMQLPDRWFRVTATPDTAVAAYIDSTRNGFVGIANHAPPPKIWVSSTTDAEPRPGDTTYLAHFRISLTAPSGVPYTVVVRTSDGSAVQDVNYRGRLDTLVFAAKETWKDYTVRLLNDGAWDTSKTYFVTVVDRGGLGDSLGSKGTGTIVNSDTLLAAITPRLQTVGKDTADTGYALFHVTLNVPANQAVTLTYASVDSSVQAAGLYVPISGRITFRPGQVDTTLRVVVPPSPLKLTQANYFQVVLDSAKVKLSGRDSSVGYSGKIATVRIFDATAAARLVIDDASTPKRDTLLAFKLHLSRPIATAQSVQFRTVSGSALAGRDFRDTSGTFTFAALDTTGTIYVHVLADSAYFVNPRTFTLSLSYNDTLIFLKKGDATGTITDNTAPPQISIQDAPPVRETQTAWFTLLSSKPDADTVRVVWSTVDLSAKAGTNYVGHTHDTLVLPPRSRSVLLPVATLDDGVYDTTLHFQVRIDTVLGGGALVGSPRVGTGAIFDGGALPAVKFAVPDTSVREDLSPDSLWLPVVLTRKIGYPVTVPVRVDSLLSTAKVPGNFSLATLSVTFPAGTDTARVLVLIHHDSINTDNLVAVLKLRPVASDSLVAGADSVERVTIRNVDPPPYISFSDSLLKVREADTTIQVPLGLSKISGKTISGTVVVSGGNARPGIDYELPSGAFLLSPGTASTSVALKVHDDHRYGPPRDLWVRFTPLDTSKVLVDPLTSRATGDDRDTVFHLVILESTARPDLSFSPVADTANDKTQGVDLGVVLSALSDSVAKAGVVFLDSSKPDLAKLHLRLVKDTATVDSGKTTTTVRLVWTNDGKVVDTARTVHLVLRKMIGAGIGRDSIVTVVIRNTNGMPVVDLITPKDSSRTNKATEPGTWTVDGVQQPPITATYVPGWNLVKVCFTDTAGNTACDSAHVWYDPYPPVVQVFKITGRNPLAPSRDTTWWGDKARTRFGVDTVWYWVRDSIESADGKSWRVVVDTHMVVTDFHGDSLFAVPVQACDSAGNCGRDTGWISLKQSIPQVNILTPPNGARVVVGELPVVHQVTDAGKTWQVSGSETVTTPGNHAIVRCYTDDVGNTGCDTHTVVVNPNQVVTSYYLDTDGDGRVDAAVVVMESPWTSPGMPSFTFKFDDSTRTGQKPDSAHPYYSGSPRGNPVVVGKDTIWVEAGSYLTDSLGHPLLGPDGKPLTSILGDTARKADGSVMRDSLGRVLYVMTKSGVPDPTRFLVPIKPPFAFGQTGFAVDQPATMTVGWTTTDSSGKKTTHSWVDSFGVGEKVPPVIVSAQIRRTESYKGQDTLLIKPSEPIDLTSKNDWLEVWRCPDAQIRCDSTSMTWVKVPADSVHKKADGSYWFLVPPGDTGSVRPNYKVRFLQGVTDTGGNRTDTSNIHWATVVTGPPRPDLVEIVPPSHVAEIPPSEANRTYPGTVLFKATKGKSDGTSNSLQWWEPGKGYNVDMGKVRDACPQDAWCNGPTIYVNRPVRMLVYIYDLVGTFVASQEANITQADIDAMLPDQLDRVSVQLEWNHRTREGKLVATGVYVWRIVSWVDVAGRPTPVMTNNLFRIGVKIRNQ